MASWITAPQDFVYDADALFATWFLDAGHTGDLDTLSTYLAASGVTFRAHQTPPDEPLHQDIPVVYIQTRSLGKLDADETITENVGFLTTFTLFTNGSIESKAGDPVAAQNDAQRVLGVLASMIPRITTVSINALDTTYLNVTVPDVGEPSLEENDHEQPWERSSIDVTWAHNTPMYS